MTMSHPHAEKMALYAKDASETDTPWERWEYYDSGSWISLKQNPGWNSYIEYRRKFLPGDGWIQWSGGECPVEPASKPEVMFSNGKHKKLEHTAMSVNWRLKAGNHAIIAYKPDPYGHLRQALANGEELQYLSGRNMWQPFTDSVFYYSADRYRIARSEMIPLEIDDIPPGSFFQRKEYAGSNVGIISPSTWMRGSIEFQNSEKSFRAKMETLKEEFNINRSIPLKGKWDPSGWEPCEKEKKQ